MRKSVSITINIAFVMMLSVLMFTGCGGSGNEGGSDTGNGEEITEAAEEESSDSSDGTTNIIDEDIDVGNNWKYAYNDGTYIFYYQNISEDVCDSNVVLSIAKDDNLKGVDAEDLVESLQKQSSDAKVNMSEDTAGGNKVVYMEFEEINGETKAYVGQYIVLGNKKGLIFSVYAEESKFESARKNTREVIDTLKIK